MKISYIITPFQTSDYLIRCVNSILRQIYWDNEVIIAENSFDKDGDIGDYLSLIENVKLISDQPVEEIDKINEAVSLADGESVCFLSVDTVAVPIASEIAESKKVDIVFGSLAIKESDGYRSAIFSDNVLPDGELPNMQSFFIKKKLFTKLSSEIFNDRIAFELWLDMIIADGASYNTSNEICFYVDKKIDFSKENIVQEYLKNSGIIINIIEKSVNSGTKEGLALFEKYLARFYKLLNSEQHDNKTKSDIFSFIKEMGKSAKENEIAKKLFRLYLGVDIDLVETMNIKTYLFYVDRLITLSDKTLIKDQIKQMAEETTSSLNRSFSEINMIRDKQKAQVMLIDTLEDDIKVLKKDIAALTQNMHFAMQSSTSGSGVNGYENPVQEIPEEFAQGKVGLKVILRSFKAWLKYKFSGKKN